MKIRVKGTLTKTTEPIGAEIVNQAGEIIQFLDDGYSLIRFDGIDIYSKKNKGYHKFLWYVHENDFYLITSRLNESKPKR